MDNINDIFTEEEKNFLNEIQQKIMDHIGTGSEKTVEELTSFKNYDNLVHPERITNAPVELTFVIKAVATELGEDGLPKETLQVLEKFYHIPIINNKNYKEYIDKFLNHFETKLEKTCQEMQNE